MPPLNSRHAGRSGNPNYLAQGFVQYDRAFPSKGMDVDPHHGGSATLEYALADCSLSLMADVVTLMAPLCAEALPALSRARTVKLYAVLADSPVLV